VLSSRLEERYSSWRTELGKAIENGKVDFEALEKYVKKNQQEGKRPQKISGKQELYELLLNDHLY
jgi:xylose isomerase